MECQLEDNGKFVFWFFVWKVYLFLLWAVVFLEEGDLVFSVKGQFLGYFNIDDRFIYLGVWLYLFILDSFCYQLYLVTLGVFACCIERISKCLPGFKASHVVYMFCWDYRCLFLCNPPLWLCMTYSYTPPTLYSVELEINVSNGPTNGNLCFLLICLYAMPNICLYALLILDVYPP